MLSQFKYNLRQAISCIQLHSQELQETCSDSLQPLNDKLTQILPNKLWAIFSGIITSKSYTSIQQFFDHIEQMQKDIEEPLTIPDNTSNKLSKKSSQNSPPQIKHGYIRKRRDSVRKIQSEYEVISHCQSYAAIPSSSNDKQLVDLIFSQYKKVDEGSKKLRSFAEKQLFKNTLNYHKIIRFLQDIKAKLLPDLRLKLLVLIKKKSQESNFVKKQQFSLMFKDIKTLFSVTSDMQQEFLAKRNQEILTKKRLFSRKIQSRSQRKVSKIPTIHDFQKSTVKINPQRFSTNKSFSEKPVIIPMASANIDKSFRQPSSPNLQKSTHISQSRVYDHRKSQATINWQNISKLKNQTNSKYVKTPHLSLNPLSGEDDYYLNEFLKSSNLN